MNKALKALGVLTTFVMLIVLIGVPSLQKQVPTKDAADSTAVSLLVFSLN